MNRLKAVIVRWLLNSMTGDSNLVSHARREMQSGLASTEGGPNRWMSDQVLQLIQLFSTHGHSGSSAPFAVQMFSTLASFKPLDPLTGEDSEWVEVSEGSFQNNRCGRVFKDGQGNAYDIEGKVFRDSDGGAFTSRGSRVPVTFPYTPTTEYVDVPK